jgi:UPF0755 protein
MSQSSIAQALRKAIRTFSAMVLLCALIAGGVYYELSRPLNLPAETIVEVRNGETLRGVMAHLQATGTVNQPQALFVGAWARFSHELGTIRAGEYRVTPGINCLGLVQLLRSGKVILHEIRFIEGWRFSQLWHQVEQDPNLSHILPDDGGAALMRALGEPSVSPEGRFFPDTYRFTKGTTDLALLHQAYQAMEHRLAAAWAGRADKLPYTSAQDALVMASLIEKETAVDAERAQIAGVFVRRLQLPMRLQTDPAVIYGLGDRFDGNLRSVDLHTDTPWNTYTRDGLPPTAICMPSEAALLAALHPAEGNALYFVARGDGTHQFSATLDQHNAAVQRYQLGGSRHGS